MNKPYSLVDDPDYRANVGIMLINRNHQVLAGEAFHYSNEWMMPQGGIDAGESPLQAMKRELVEETSILFDQVKLIAEHHEWLSYLFRQPLEKDGGVYVGQRQKWFLLEYNGAAPDATQTIDKEFKCFEWVDPGWLMEHTTSFKTGVYKNIFAEFGHFFP
jgi:putative (di)nucleoside polyphosphate hydrolase